MADPTKFTAKEVLNKVLLDSSGNAVSANSVTSQEALSMALDATNNRLNVALEGGTISGDVTISGDLTVSGGGSTFAYNEVVTGDMIINRDASGDSAENGVGLYVDFDRTVASSGTAAHNDIGINLDVNSASLGTSSVIGMDIDVVGATSGTSTATGLTVDVGSADTNYAALLNGGKVGIGTGSVAHRTLDVMDNAAGITYPLRVYNDSAESATHGVGIQFGCDTYGADGTGDEGKGALVYEVSTSYARGKFHFLQNTNANRGGAVLADSVFTIQNDGKVGIGTASPTGLFSIYKTGGAPEMIWEVAGNSGARNWGWRASGSAWGDFQLRQGSSLGGALDTARITILDGGNVGIGGTPTSKLHVHDSVDGASIVHFDNVAGGSSSVNETMALHLNLGDGSTIRGGAKITAKKELDYSTGVNMDASLMFSVLQNNAFNDALFITSAGNIGIGVSEPAAKLEIHGGAYNTSLLIKGAGSNTGIKFVDSDGNIDGYVYSASGAVGFMDSGGDWMVEARNDDSIKFHVTASTKMVLDANSRISLSNNGGAANNTIFGYSAGASIHSSSAFNTFIGHEVSDATMTADADYNTGVGALSLGGLTAGQENTAVGYKSLADNLTGNNNVAIGTSALENTTVALLNVAVGQEAMGGITTNAVQDVVAIGVQALKGAGGTTTGANGTIAIGRSALAALTSGSGNTAVGYQSLDGITTSAQNTAVGYSALTAVGDSYANTAVGYQAGDAISNSGAFNVCIGTDADVSTGSADNQIVIGRATTGVANNSVTLGNSAVTAVYMAQDSGATVHADKYMSTTMPAFMVTPASTQSNIANDESEVTVVFGTEIFDQGSNFASNTFTAPVTGKYQFNVTLRLDNIDTAAAYYILTLKASNRDVKLTFFDPDFADADIPHYSIGGSVLVDMDASDTCHLVVIQNGGTAQSDIQSTVNTQFSGYLVC